MNPYSEEQYITGTQRLQQLELHIREGQLAHQNFDFSAYNYNNEEEVAATGKKMTGNACGTNGCAIGEMPKVWPDSWIWRNNAVYAADVANPSNQPHMNNLARFLDWFAITSDEYQHLFYPESQTPQLFGGKDLDDFSTREEVASNMREFLIKCRTKYIQP